MAGISESIVNKAVSATTGLVTRVHFVTLIVDIPTVPITFRANSLGHH